MEFVRYRGYVAVGAYARMCDGLGQKGRHDKVPAHV